MKTNRNDENRILCTTCNIWIANNRAQRDQHESGAKHKAAQIKLIKNIAEKNEVRRKEEELSKKNAGSAQGTIENDASNQLLQHAMRAVDFKRTQYQPAMAYHVETPSNQFSPSGNDNIFNGHHNLLQPVEQVSIYSNQFKKPTANESISVGTSEKLTDTDTGELENFDDEYPLPASEIFGKWTDVDGEDEPKDMTNNDEVTPTNNMNTSKQGEIRAQSDDLESEQNKDSTEITKDKPALQSSTTATPGIANISFKRKMPSLSKRKRRKKG